MPDRSPKRFKSARRPVLKVRRTPRFLRRFVFDGEPYVGVVSAIALGNYRYHQAFLLWRGDNKANQPLRIIWTMPRYDYWLCDMDKIPPEIALPHRDILPRELVVCVRQARQAGWTGELRTHAPFDWVVDDHAR
ncbi:hypothetical protein [Armatimonas rosea]|uniref:Uncharacterized protein n=1 Tax=Armatimonas rosea TaxID=685828 RepID=A0A7W9ST79_ARMRO|nr:hypothetical protein [Armatimonas rosea]MBB6052406.1 hypothetical protein [Armatimonas rosea]